MMLWCFADSILLRRSPTANDVKGHITRTYDCMVTRSGFYFLILGDCATREEGEEPRPMLWRINVNENYG